MILINSEDELLIQSKISNLLKTKNIFDFNRFDFCNEFPWDELIANLQQEKLFHNVIDVYVINLDHYLKNKKQWDIVQKQLLFIHSLATQNQLIICTTSSTKIDERLINLKIFQEQYNLEKITKANKLNIIKDELAWNKLELANADLAKLTMMLPKNAMIIKNEIIKLTLNPTAKIENLICDYNDYELYQLLNLFLQKDYVNLFTILKTFLSDLESAKLVFNYTITKMLNLFLIKKASLAGLSPDEIATKLNLSKFIILNDLKLIFSMKIQDIENILYNLFHIEIINRTISVDLKLLLKLFFLNVKVR